MSSPHASEAPAKKQTKWSPEEDALIIELRGRHMKWDDISERLPGRSPISCRLHYQNYLEKRAPWDDEMKTKLARLYERLKPDMWQKVADEMAMPWRAVEAMHWRLGELDMAKRVGTTPFSMMPTSPDNSSSSSSNTHHQHHNQQRSPVRPARGHAHSRSQSTSVFRDAIDPSRAYGRNIMMTTTATTPLPPGTPSGRSLDFTPRTEPGILPSHMPPHSFDQSEPMSYSHSHSGGPLAPIQQSRGGQSARPGMLPGLAELTTGVSPYSTPAYSIGAPTASPAHSGTASPGPFVPVMTYPSLEPVGSKRRRSPEYSPIESNRRRHLESSLEQSIPRHMP